MNNKIFGLFQQNATTYFFCKNVNKLTNQGNQGKSILSRFLFCSHSNLEKMLLSSESILHIHQSRLHRNISG